MKTINNYKKTITSTILLAFAFVMTINLVKADPINEKNKDSINNKKVAAIEANILENIAEEEQFIIDLEMFNPKVIKILDQHDNLVYEGTPVEGTPCDKDMQLVQLLLRSDFVMEYENTSYYRIQVK